MKKLIAIMITFCAALWLASYLAPARAQPCQWHYTDPANVSTATYCGNVVVLGSITGSFPNTNAVSILQYGAICDGVNDDTAEIQAAIVAAQTLRLTLVIPATVAECKITSGLTVTAPLVIVGDGTIEQVTGGEPGITVTSGNVSISGITLVGPQSATYEVGESALYIHGTLNAGLAPTYIENVALSNLKISNWGDSAVDLRYIDKFSISGLTVNDIVRAGVGGSSVKNGTITRNNIDNVTGTGVSGNNAYGIFVSREANDAGNLTSQPRSEEVVVANNVVRNVPTWECYDTHAGTNITFTGNTCYNAMFGISVGESPNSAGTQMYGSLNIAVTGNAIDCGVTDGSRGYGIPFTGAQNQEYTTGSIVGNVIKNCGLATAATSGGIYTSQANVTISGNQIFYPSPNCFYLTTATIATLSGNHCIDPWTNTVGVGEANGIAQDGTDSFLNIGPNTFLHADKSATYLLTTASGIAVNLSASAGNVAALSQQVSNATTYLVDDAHQVSGVVTANGTTPVVTANTAVKANSRIILTPLPGQTGKGAFVSAIVSNTSFSVTSLVGDNSNYAYRIEQ